MPFIGRSLCTETPRTILAPRRSRLLQQRLVQNPAREPAGEEGQVRFGRAPAVEQADARHPACSEPVEIEAEIGEIGLRLDAQELAADLVPRLGIALDQKGRASRIGEDAGGRGAGKPAADDHDLLLARDRSFQAAHAEAEGDVPADLCRPGRDPGRCQDALPFLAPEAAGDRDRPVVADEAMPARGP